MKRSIIFGAIVLLAFPVLASTPVSVTDSALPSGAATDASLQAATVTPGQVAPSLSIPVALPTGVSGTLQNAAVSSTNGSTLATDGMAVAILTVNCATCSGGTTVNFEGTEDGTNFASIAASLVGTSTIANSTTTSGITIWQVPVAGFVSIRARTSAYSAGTVTVTGHTVQTPWAPRTEATLNSRGSADQFRCSVSFTDGAAHTCQASAGTGISNYVTDWECFRNDAGTSAITVSINDGATTIIGLPNGGGGGGNNKSLNTPLKVAAATALQFTASTGTTTVYCSAQGFQAP